jgi:sulfatase modifying factor 1
MRKILWIAGCCLVLGALPVLGECPSEDVTGDCFVDLEDFAVLSSQWTGTLADFDSLVSQWLTGTRLPDDLAMIPAGTFQMGNSKSGEGYANELPVHTVTLDSFAIGKYEVTNEQYCAFLNSAYPSQLKVVNWRVYASSDIGNSLCYCRTSMSSSESQIVFSNDTFSIRTKEGKDMSHHPMVQVTWYGAVAYCNWRSQQEGRQISYDLSTWNCDLSKKGYRLATEAEWEYAARGGRTDTRFPWGDTINHSNANYRANGSAYSYDTSPYSTYTYHPTWNDGIVPYTSPMGSFTPNDYGLYDMAGNVREWCNDWYLNSYYSPSSQTNPTGPATGSWRVNRGGGWTSYANFCRVAYRSNLNPTSGSDDIGFRIVLGLN